MINPIDIIYQDIDGNILEWVLLPGHDHNKVHNVPDVSEIRVRMKDEAERQDLQGRLDAENE